MTDFGEVWRASLRFRRASRELEPLLSDLYQSMSSPGAVLAPLESLLLFLSSVKGRTDANCSVTYHFISASEERWAGLPDEQRQIFDDMSGTLQDSIHAPNIARTFESTPEQLLQRVRNLR